jgi:glycosyltransferase involved in cell wall biosynthesis
MNLVSVILPVYNSAAYLERTIKSVLFQTYPQLELIIIDDGSTDQSVEIANKYAHLPNVRLITQINAGAAIARNTGLKSAKGNYIQFIDAGDVISKDKIEKQVASLHGDFDKLAVCNYKIFKKESELQASNFPDQSSFIFSSNNPQEFLINLWGGNGERNFIQTNCWLVPKKLIDKAGVWREYRCPDDDGEFFARVILASNGIVYTPGVYNYYHAPIGETNQLSKSKNHKYLMNTLLTIDLKYHYLLKKGFHTKIKKAISSQYLMFAVDVYPAQPVLSKIAYRRYKRLNEKAKIPVLGGSLVELCKYLLGWRITKSIKGLLGKS